MKNSSKILVIDDDPNTVRLLKKWCENAGKNVIGSLNGREGIQKALEERPDLILLDVMLPDIGGMDVVRALRRDPLTSVIPVFFITVTMGVEQDKGDETVDVDGRLYRIFAKPLHPQKLLSEIRKSINRRLHGNPSPIEGS
ncbi:MAG TPA: response regulator [Candidatus Omnitrophota bacterium]|nr:response regulator [Candidatus Omnitrophota bacterium]HPN55830.1 response regulator [Candidatus Omnitrophota bacterium]